MAFQGLSKGRYFSAYILIFFNRESQKKKNFTRTLRGLDFQNKDFLNKSFSRTQIGLFKDS